MATSNPSRPDAAAPRPRQRVAPAATPAASAPAPAVSARKLDISYHEGSTVARRISYGVEVETTETIRVPFFGDIKPAYVAVGGSVTKNLGDYNSAKVEVRISMPCLPEMSEVQRVYEMLSNKIDELVPQELDKAMGAPAA